MFSRLALRGLPSTAASHRICLPSTGISWKSSFQSFSRCISNTTDTAVLLDHSHPNLGSLLRFAVPSMDHGTILSTLRLSERADASSLIEVSSEDWAALSKVSSRASRFVRTYVESLEQCAREPASLGFTHTLGQHSALLEFGADEVHLSNPFADDYKRKFFDIFGPLRDRARSCTDAAVFETIWDDCLAALQELPIDHPLHIVPIPLVLLGNRKEYLDKVRRILFLERRGMQITNRSSISLGGVKAVGKSTFVKIACAMSTLLSPGVIGVYVNYHSAVVPSFESDPQPLPPRPSEALAIALNARLNTYKHPPQSSLGIIYAPFYPMFFMDEVDQLLKKRLQFHWSQLGELPQMGSGRYVFATITSSSAQMQRMIKNPRSLFSASEALEGAGYLPGIQNLNGSRYPPHNLYPAEDRESLLAFLKGIMADTEFSETDLQQIMYDTGGAWGAMANYISLPDWRKDPPLPPSTRMPDSVSVASRVLLLLVMRFFHAIIQHPSFHTSSLPTPTSLRARILQCVDFFAPPTISQAEVEYMVSLVGNPGETASAVIERLVDGPILREHTASGQYCLAVPSLVEMLAASSVLHVFTLMRQLESPFSDIHLMAKAIASGEAIVVVGAGVSSAISRGNPKVTWIGLLQDGLQFYSAHGVKDPQVNEWLSILASTSSSVSMKILTDIGEFLKRDAKLFHSWISKLNTLTPLAPQLGTILAGLHIPLLTTNYDNLLSGVIGYDMVTLDSPLEEVRAQLKGGRSILHIHGAASKPESIVISATDYDSAIHNERLQQIRSYIGPFKTCIFVGYGAGMNDPHFRHLFESLHRVWGPTTHTMHYQLVLGTPSSSSTSPTQVSYGSNHEDLPRFLSQLSHLADFYRSIVRRF